jgi:hypothetical protein
MKRFFLLCILLLAVVIPSRAQDHALSSVPPCAVSYVQFDGKTNTLIAYLAKLCRQLSQNTEL